MNKQIKHTYGGMTKDISKSRFPNTSYYDASAFRVTASEGQSTYSLANEKGTKVQITFPDYTVNSTHLIVPVSNYTVSIPYNVNDIPLGLHKDHKLVGSINVKDGIIFFTTGTIDTIWLYKFDNENHIQLLYARDLGLSQEYQVSGISNYENNKIEKIYWVDGLHQIRHLNIRHSIANGDYEELINIPTDNINMMGKVKLTQPIIKDVLTGGTHTVGVIQYAYSLYRINGSQSQTSPLSEQVPLNNTAILGSSVNQQANTVPVVRIENISENYTNIIVYSIKYTSYNVTPEVSVIYDQTIPDNRNVEIYDDGSIINSTTIEEFLFLSSDIITPKHINTKDNYMFYSNYEEKNFKVNLDVRAYSFDIYGSPAISKVYSDVESLTNLNNTPSRTITPDNFPDNPNDTFDNINLDFDTYKYSLSFFDTGSQMIPTIGGTSKYLTYEVIPTTVRNSRNKYFKDDEIYRLGIEFYNEYGKKTLPMWISDFKAPSGNMRGWFNTLKFTWKQAFYDWYNSQNFDEYSKPVGYKLLIAERNHDDKTIITSGAVSPMMINSDHLLDKYITLSPSSNPHKDYIYDINDEDKAELNENLTKLPNFLIRNLKVNADSRNDAGTFPMLGYINDHSMSMRHNAYTEILGVPQNSNNPAETGATWQYNKMLQLYSPDTVFNTGISLSGGLRAKLKGLFKNTFNGVYAQEREATSDRIIIEGKANESLSAMSANPVLHDYGLVSHPGGEDPNIYQRNLFYRQYGNLGAQITNFSKDLNGFYFLTNSRVFTSLVQDTNLSINYANINVTTGNDIQITIQNITNNTIYYRFQASFVLNTILNVTLGNNYDYDFDIFLNGSLYDTVDGTSSTEVITATFNEISSTIGPGGNAVINLIPKLKPHPESNGYYYKKGTLDLKPELNVDHILQISSDSNFNTNEETSYKLDYIPLNFILNSANLYEDYSQVYQEVDEYFNTYGQPELALKGQTAKAYNNDNKYRYSNTLQSFLTAGNYVERRWDNNGIYNRRVVSIDSESNSNITFMLERDNAVYLLEDFYNSMSNQMDDAIPLFELVKSENDIYLGGIYGGNSYEDKRRTRYNGIGSYVNITQPSVQINSPGDTFVQTFRFLRIVRRADNVINEGTYHMEEIVEFPIETTVDLENRNDVSHNSWDAKISYSDEEFHHYNRVFSQPNNLLQTQNNEYTTKELSDYETNVIASKLKTPGELIDSWLDLSPNEQITLDGKFGPITNLLYLNDEIYTLQDRAFSKLSINPRIQVQGSDGISIELGSGQVLQDYQYITTDIGCKNKHGSIITPYGIYFYDSNNKRLNLYNGQITPLSETAGLHSHLYNKNLNNVDLDKPLKGTGLSLGYDYINNDVYFSFLTNNEDAFTLRYTEKGNLFMDDNKYLVNHYAGFGDKFYGNLSDNKIHQFGKGGYNNYFGVIIPSTLTLIVNPEADLSVIINNIMFKSEAYLDGVDQPNITLTHIRAYNEYQDSGLVPLVNNRRGNIQRLFREWNAQVPRVAGTRERIRNPWTYLELTFNNPNNYKFILHDMNISYSV